MIRFRLLLLTSVLLGGTPLIAAETVHLYLSDGKSYRVELNGVFSKLCTLRSAQVVSPRDAIIDGDPDRPRNKFFDPFFDVSRVKKGEVLGDSRLVGEGETFPFDVALKGVTVSAAQVRSNGTWSMTLRWTACENIPKR